MSKPYGAGGTSYHVNVNRFHYGQIVRVNGGQWIAYPNSNDLPKACWDALVKWVEDNERKEEKEGGH